VDGYWANYSLSYKHAFRRVIAGELDKDPALKKYFDEWGSRVYLFNSEIGVNTLMLAGNQTKLRQLDYDWTSFVELGGQYVLSAVEIDTLDNPRLALERKFQSSSSAWDVYLYRVIPL
jgi:hypothetical protein